MKNTKNPHARILGKRGGEARKKKYGIEELQASMAKARETRWPKKESDNTLKVR